MKTLMNGMTGRALSLLLLVAGYAPEGLAQISATPVLPQSSTPPPYSCAFLDPVHFGASISAGYGNLFDGGAAFVRDVAFHDNYYGSNINPVQDIQKSLFNSSEPLNLSEMYGSANKFHADGPRQLESFLATPEGKKRFSRTSMLASLDAFYWPSTMQSCQEVLAGVDSVIDLARKEHKPLVLGNVPNERKEFVDPILVWHGWVAPPKKCVDQINAKLAQRCDPKQQCYLIDLHSVIDKLNYGKLIVNGVKIRPKDFRSDGIHLTDYAKKYIEVAIVKAMEANPPACSVDEAAKKKSHSALSGGARGRTSLACGQPGGKLSLVSHSYDCY